MARDYAAIYTNVWADSDWRRLNPRLQHGYWLFLTQPRLSPCGVLDFIPKRFAGLAAGLTACDVEGLVADLEAVAPRPWLIHDESTAEVLVRSYVRHDGLITGKRPAKAIAKDFDSISSSVIRQAVVDELRRLRREKPKLAGWDGIKEELPALLDLVDASERPRLTVIEGAS